MVYIVDPSAAVVGYPAADWINKLQWFEPSCCRNLLQKLDAIPADRRNASVMETPVVKQTPLELASHGKLCEKRSCTCLW